MQNGPGLDSGWVGLAGLGRAGWAGLAGWLGWLAGLPGLACWAGCAGPGWAGTLPGIGFVDFWNQGQNLIKSSFLGLVFSISGANARKCLNRASWDSFCRLLEPRPESHQIKLPGTGFLDFWSQRQKVFKSSFLGFVLSTSGAKARKSSNRVSWDWFSRFLEPTPESLQSDFLGLVFSTSGPPSPHPPTGPASEADKTSPTNFDLNDFLALAPEVDKTDPRKLDLKTFWRWLAPKVEKTSPRKLDLITFWPWLQKSTKRIPRSSI